MWVYIVGSLVFRRQIQSFSNIRKKKLVPSIPPQGNNHQHEDTYFSFNNAQRQR